jgi:adenylate cyclase
LAGISATSVTLGKMPWDPDVLASVREFFMNFAFWSIIIYAGFLNVLFLFIIEVSNSFGSKLFWRFFSGKYHKPKIEKRGFMFLDLKGSTQLAEGLGHEQYYKFINQFIEDVSREVIRTWGTIYQYVGDEIVMIWPWEKRQLSVDCYFRIKESIERNQSDYLRSYGVAPRFRVGIHGGDVLIGEIGSYKKDILYIGDVLNATSRIEQLCKEKEVDILVSEKIISISEMQHISSYEFIDMGESTLRGKSEKVRLYSIELTNQH